MQVILDFFSNYWVHLVVLGAVTAAGPKVIDWIQNGVKEKIFNELEQLRADLNSNPVLEQLKIDDKIIDIFESYIPEVLHELEDTMKNELTIGKFSLMDWKSLGVSLWAKARAEIEAGAVDYMKTSGEQDGEVLASVILKKFVMKQAAIKQGLIDPHS